MDSHEAFAYCSAIRNRDKRQYAFAVLDYQLGKRSTMPERPVNLSVMAAQAVRLNLRHVARKGE